MASSAGLTMARRLNTSPMFIFMAVSPLLRRDQGSGQILSC
jgi:hypothetical protein